jgi:hypothetical protein
MVAELAVIDTGHRKYPTDVTNRINTWMNLNQSDIVRDIISYGSKVDMGRFAEALEASNFNMQDFYRFYMSENKGTPAQILDIRGEAYTKYVVKFLLAIHTSPYYCYGMTDHLSRINGVKPDLPGFITETQEDTSKRQATKDVRKD